MNQRPRSRSHKHFSNHLKESHENATTQLELLGRIRKVFGKMCLIDFKQGIEYVTKLDNIHFAERGTSFHQPTPGDYVNSIFFGISTPKEIEENLPAKFEGLTSGFIMILSQRQIHNLKKFEQTNGSLDSNVRLFANDYVFISGTSDQIQQSFIKLNKIINDEPN